MRHSLNSEITNVNMRIYKTARDALNLIVVSTIKTEREKIRQKLDSSGFNRKDTDLFCKKYKDLKNIKNKINNVLSAAEHDTVENWTYNHLSESDCNIIQKQSNVLTQLFEDSSEKDNYITLLADVEELTYVVSTQVLWQRRAAYVFVLLAFGGIGLTIVLILFTPTVSLATLPFSILFAFWSLGGFLCLAPVATQPMTTDVNGMSFTTQIPGFQTPMTLLQVFLFPFLFRSKIASWTISPPREVAAQELQDAVFNYLANNILTENNKKKVEQARSLYQEGVNSWFYETGIDKRRRAISNLQKITNADQNDEDESSQNEIDDDSKFEEPQSYFGRLCSLFTNRPNGLYHTFINTSKKRKTQ